jgi:hypothetical protein
LWSALPGIGQQSGNRLPRDAGQERNLRVRGVRILPHGRDSGPY